MTEFEKSEYLYNFLKKEYRDLCRVYLKDDTYVRISEDKRMELKKEANKSFIEIAHQRVNDEYIDKAETFLDLSTLNERMKDVDKISRQFISKDDRWYSGSFIVDERDEQRNIEVVFFAVRDIKEEKEIEKNQKDILADALNQAELANNAKSSFLSSMSHDIRTPINGIVGMTAIAMTHIEDRIRVEDCLQKITVASNHLLSLINEVLDMSKIESGKMELAEDKFDLSELIGNLITMVRPQIKKRKHKLSVNISNVEHEKVIGDSLRIQQMFMNFMSNAIKYTPDGGTVKLTISEKTETGNKRGCFEFTFEDNGIGMSSDFVDKIFQPFARAEDSRINKITGTGLGMPIARNIVRLMDGDIKVDSALDKGTKFTVTIFLKLQNSVEEVNKEFENLPILIVDDDEISSISSCNVLKEVGMAGEIIHSGMEALEKIVHRCNENRDYFAVICNRRLKDIDGISFTKELQKRLGDKMPIVVIATYDWAEIEQEARKAGASAFISKPLFKSRVIHLFNGLTGCEKEEKYVPLKNFKDMDLHGYRVLLVEDNELNAEIAIRILGMTGMEVEWAEDGIIAVDKITNCEDDYYDLVFMDIQMPKMNGYEATSAIRALDREYTKRLPIIAMTANAFAEDVQAAKSSGMNGHIAKPLDLQVLSGVLAKWIK